LSLPNNILLRQTLFLTLAILLCPARAPAADLNLDLTAGTHANIADYGFGICASLDLTLAAAWAPIPEVAFGLETALGVPLQSGAGDRQTDLTLRATPAVWLRFGEEEVWAYLKTGCGLDSHLADGEMKAVLVIIAAAGFAVAPRTLLFHFGFEISGQYELAGGIPTRAIGLGGFMGYRF
jgi:hypothetical protein